MPTSSSVSPSPICSIDKDDIMWVDFQNIEHVAASQVLSVYRWHVETDNTPKAVINIMLKGKSVTMEAIGLLEKPPVSEMILCSAVVLESKLVRFFSRLYLPMHSPPYPIRLFGNQEEAKKWLLKTRAEVLAKH